MVSSISVWMHYWRQATNFFFWGVRGGLVLEDPELSSIANDQVEWACIVSDPQHISRTTSDAKAKLSMNSKSIHQLTVSYRQAS